MTGIIKHTTVIPTTSLAISFVAKNNLSSSTMSQNQSSFSVNTATSSSSQLPFLTKSSKEYDAAFAQLSSQYGFAGGIQVPSTPSSKTSCKKPSAIASKAQPSLNRWESAYADLSSQYGFGGSNIPSLPSKKKSKAVAGSNNQETRKSRFNVALPSLPFTK